MEIFGGTKGLDARSQAFLGGVEVMESAVVGALKALAQQLDVEHHADVPPYTPQEVAELVERFAAKAVGGARRLAERGNPFVVREMSSDELDRLARGVQRTGVIRTPADEPLASARPPSRGKRKPLPDPEISGSSA